jgi:hypothetical protein
MNASPTPPHGDRSNPETDSPAPDKAPGTGRKQLTAWIAADMHKRMMRLKAEEGVDLREQLTSAMEQYLTAKGY